MGEVYRAQDTRLGRTVAIKVLSFIPVAGCRVPGTLCARGARHLQPFASEHLRALRRRQPRRRGLHRDGVPGRRDAGGAHEEGPAADRAGFALRHGSGHGPRGGAQAWNNPPRPEAGQRHVDEVPAPSCSISASRRSNEQPSAGPEARAKDDRLTATGMVIGTLHYMAPEQIEGHEADARTDVFALGCVLYESVSGRAALQGDSTSAVMRAILDTEPPLSRGTARRFIGGIPATYHDVPWPRTRKSAGRRRTTSRSNFGALPREA